MKLSKFLPLLPAMILMACSSPPPPPPPVPAQLPIAIQSARGIDIATDAGGVLNELTQNHVDFVARYYRGPESRWPPLSIGEARLLSSLGLKIVAVWESHSRTPGYFSYSSGFSDAMTAYRQAKAIGQPPGSAIYFAVDFNAQGRSFERIDEYFRGIQAGLAAASGRIPDYAVGVYGSGAVCDAVKAAGLARYAWLSNSIAWTGSIGYQDWDIRQGGRLPELSFNHDGDEARDDYGAFQVASGDFAAPLHFAPAQDVAQRTPQPGQSLAAAQLVQPGNQAAAARGRAAAAALPAM
ncbi:MAG: DUF1906 domain-containing protein [Alphaproteobacteria bacterium]|nr:DUF1906 domain-containing protein [Alphaproteobacteria bacterium]